MVIVAGLLFAAVFVLRVADGNASQAITLLYALPIALLAVELGVRAGLAAAALALALFATWEIIWAPDLYGDALAYLTRGAVFFVIGGFVGALADRVRNVSADSSRFWQLSTDLLGTAGFDGYLKRVNPAWERTLGWTARELCSQPFLDFVHPDDRERTAAEAAGLMSVGYETLVFENRYRCKDGSYRTILWDGSSTPDEGLIYATGTDITDSKRAQEKLRSSERFLESVLETLPTTVFIKDADQLRFVRINRAGEELLGRPRETLIGKNDHDLYPAEQADRFSEEDRAALACDGVVDTPEHLIQTNESRWRLLHTRRIAIRDERGEPRYVLGISQDITDRKLAERTADAAQAEAARASHAKSEFLSKMSHELRTPLNAVIGFAQLLQLDRMDARQEESTRQILKAGRHLLELINEVLDISRIESGTMSTSLEPVHLGSVLADALSLIRPLADDANVRLAATPPGCVDQHVLADQQRLKQVFINLLSNAVKYNRPGGEVSVRCTQLGQGRIEVAVADTGCGMNAEQLARIFEPFDRLGAESTDVEGTGLGLPLCRGLLQAMGGSITAESQPQTGSTIRVQLDGAEDPGEEHTVGDAAPRAANESSPARHTIVYIEDNLSNLKLVERVLERLPDVRLIPAMQGNVGIELVSQHQPDLILLDLHLPDLHGSDVLEQLKRDPATATIPVVILSADASPMQIQRLREAGAARYLTKPIDVQSLLEAVRDTVPAHSTPYPAHAARPASAPPSISPQS